MCSGCSSICVPIFVILCFMKTQIPECVIPFCFCLHLATALQVGTTEASNKTKNSEIIFRPPDAYSKLCICASPEESINSVRWPAGNLWAIFDPVQWNSLSFCSRALNQQTASRYSTEQLGQRGQTGQRVSQVAQETAMVVLIIILLSVQIKHFLITLYPDEVVN